MEKYYEIMCSCSHKQLRILIITRSLSLSILNDNCRDLVKILLAIWSSFLKRLALREEASFLGLSESLTLTTHQVKHTCVTL